MHCIHTNNKLNDRCVLAASEDTVSQRMHFILEMKETGIRKTVRCFTVLGKCLRNVYCNSSGASLSVMQVTEYSTLLSSLNIVQYNSKNSSRAYVLYSVYGD